MRNPICFLTAVILLLAAPLHAAPLHAAEPAPKKSPPADVGAGRIAWFDLTTTDLAKSRDFYTKLFDWKFTSLKETDMALEIVSHDTAIGTLRVADGAIGHFNGVVYVQVDDIRASCARAKELGGTIPPGFPFNLSDGIGAIGLVVDPSGHPIGMYSRTPVPEKDPKAK